MNRNDEIKDAARIRADQYQHPSQWNDVYHGFIDGAKWSDEHPKNEPKKREPIKGLYRSMSDMTVEEREYLQSLLDIITDENYGDGFNPSAWRVIADFVDYCNEHHLNYSGSK